MESESGIALFPVNCFSIGRVPENIWMMVVIVEYLSLEQSFDVGDVCI